MIWSCPPTARSGSCPAGWWRARSRPRCWRPGSPTRPSCARLRALLARVRRPYPPPAGSQAGRRSLRSGDRIRAQRGDPAPGQRGDAVRRARAPTPRAALDALLELDAGPDDELILADNSGVAPERDGVLVVLAVSERSPSHARNVGAEHATRDWVLFLDADCCAAPGLIERYFAQPVAARRRRAGRRGGRRRPTGHRSPPATAPRATSWARARISLTPTCRAPWPPTCSCAGARSSRSAASTRACAPPRTLTSAGACSAPAGVLEARPRARVEHRYRTSVDALRRQWRGYAAGRAWLGRRYEDFDPEPALRRAGGRVLRRRSARAAVARGRAPARSTVRRAADRGRFLALDALLGVEELAGLALSNRPRPARGKRPGPGGAGRRAVPDPRRSAG